MMLQLYVTGDQNAKLGSENEGYERNMGKFDLGERNENREKFLDFCVNNDITVRGTMLKHINIHTGTWKSPDRRTKNQIDKIVTNNKWRSSLLDLRAYSEADEGSDHYMIIAKIRLKLRAAKKEEQKIRRFDILKL